MKVVLVDAHTLTHEDQIVESFYEDMESEMDKVETQYTVLLGDLNANKGKKQAGDHEVGCYGIGTRNNRGELLVEFKKQKPYG